MSRAAVLAALRNDTILQGMVAPANIITNYSKDGRPSNIAPGLFLVLRWGGGSKGLQNITGPRDLVVWAHLPEEIGTDYTLIDQALDAAKSVLTQMVDVPGADGYTVTTIDYNAESDDMKDPGFQTIFRQMTFQVLSRKTP